MRKSLLREKRANGSVLSIQKEEIGILQEECDTNDASLKRSACGME